jgi:hypothetical protein
MQLRLAGALSLLHVSLYFLIASQLASLCGVPSLFDLRRNFITVGGEPRLLLVEHTHGALYKFVDGL